MSNLDSLCMRLSAVEMARQAGLELDPWQSKLVKSKAQRVIVNCSRQTGKSTTTAVLSCHTAFHNVNSTILLLSPSLRQSSELFRKCLDVYHNLGNPVPADTENKLSLELSNGSRIVSLPGKEGTVRGFSAIDLLVIDEASRVEEELYMAVKPMLAVSGGRLVTLSTPNGTIGWWYEAWKNRRNWEYYEVPATECPRISKEFLDSEKENMGIYWYEQEYMCKFNDSVTSAFRSEDIECIVKHDLSVWDI